MYKSFQDVDFITVRKVDDKSIQIGFKDTPISGEPSFVDIILTHDRAAMLANYINKAIIQKRSQSISRREKNLLPPLGHGEGGI